MNLKMLVNIKNKGVSMRKSGENTRYKKTLTKENFTGSNIQIYHTGRLNPVCFCGSAAELVALAKT